MQSVAVRLIVERERQRMAFVAGQLLGPAGDVRQACRRGVPGATLVSVAGRKIPASRDFDPATGKLKDPRSLVLDEPEARATCRAAPARRNAAWRTLEDRPYTTRPYPPFTTSTLQQEANRKFGFTARQTMQVAQSLYENGHITYMRTDSTSLAAVAIQTRPRPDRRRNTAASTSRRSRATYRTKVKNAQEAHEAIRPAGHPFESAREPAGRASADDFKLYDLIWKRTSPARWPTRGATA